MYIGRNSIFALDAFLLGWKFANSQIQPENFNNEEHDFQDWISKKFKIQTSQSWAAIIFFFSQDEANALKLFFELFDEWLAEYNMQNY